MYENKELIFTFQSGDIQIALNVEVNISNKNLHSNLVIFKLSFEFDDSLIVDRFTFQSGDIQILLPQRLFHSFYSIYIPIW